MPALTQQCPVYRSLNIKSDNFQRLPVFMQTLTQLSTRREQRTNRERNAISNCPAQTAIVADGDVYAPPNHCETCISFARGLFIELGAGPAS